MSAARPRAVRWRPSRDAPAQARSSPASASSAWRCPSRHPQAPAPCSPIRNALLAPLRPSSGGDGEIVPFRTMKVSPKRAKNRATSRPIWHYVAQECPLHLVVHPRYPSRAPPRLCCSTSGMTLKISRAWGGSSRATNRTVSSALRSVAQQSSRKLGRRRHRSGRRLRRAGRRLLSGWPRRAEGADALIREPVSSPRCGYCPSS